MTDAAVSHLSTASFTQIGYGPDVIALSDKVNDSPVALPDLNIFPSQGRQLGSMETATKQDRYHSHVPDAA